MHFVSSQSEAEQLADIVSYLSAHMRESLEEAGHTPAASFNDFENKIEKLVQKKDYQGILGYLLTDVRNELLALPTSHKSAPITIQRAILLVLPFLKSQELKGEKDAKTYEFLKKTTLEFCTLLEESSYPLSIKVNG